MKHFLNFTRLEFTMLLMYLINYNTITLSRKAGSDYFSNLSRVSSILVTKIDELTKKRSHYSRVRVTSERAAPLHQWTPC